MVQNIHLCMELANMPKLNENFPGMLNIWLLRGRSSDNYFSRD